MTGSGHPADGFALGADRPPRAWAAVVVLVTSFVALALVWAANAPVEELSRASGRVIPTARAQIIQSAEGGVVADILVRPGQQVSAGELLVQLDDTLTTSSAGEVEAQLRALEAQTARLRIEYEGLGAADFVCPASVAQSAPQICANELDLFRVRANGYEQGRQVLLERVEQRKRELAEARINLTRINESLALAQEDYDLMAPLAERGLVAQTSFIDVQRQLTNLEGESAATEELIGRLASALDEAQLQVAQARTQFRQEALGELTVKLAELATLREQMRGATNRVARTEIRAPVNGVVNSLEVTTIGAVVQPGERLLDIVPVSDSVLVEARLSPADVGFILAGQEANIKFTAYDFSIYGGLKGVVQNVSANSIVDPQTRETYYTVLIAADTTVLDFHGEALPILPGMVTSVEIITGTKTILQYLLKPINKARDEALRER